MIIALCGKSGSGKSTFASKIDDSLHFEEDWYFKDKKDIPLIRKGYLFDSINEKYCKKKHNKQVECYWIIQDIGVYSFIFFSVVSYMIVLVKIINVNIALSIFIVWVAKILNKHRLSLGSDPDFKPFNSYGSYDPAETLAEYRENERRREERKKDMTNMEIMMEV